MSSVSYNEIFKEYYFNNKGIIYKSFAIKINDYQYNYDIYWGDPNIIFDKETQIENLPLAVTIIPHRKYYPNARIYLHKEIEEKNKAFEVVVAHEIGHLWLHDIVGFNNPYTNNIMNEYESEKWADYFSYCFFKKYRNVDNIESFIIKLEEVNKIQIKIYDLKNEKIFESNIKKREL